ncbi:dienelactone hydrolase family protein [Cereibacter sediminicola]|uniref:dienelactone hydrolase family protein n=1 Tax=Cereibacter sediminicola TaxID=2584941 RepID=UPI0016423A35|nr:dienelactone hydrolase family protein [Cereibacter sediminicola]
MGKTGERRIMTIGPERLESTLRIPEGSRSLVIFAHGADSSRLSPRNNLVAERMGKAGIATLLFDLLTEAEAADRHNVFDIPLLGRRVIGAVNRLSQEPDLEGLPIGLFGASTGAAAALVAAARLPREVRAVVSRGGRPDLAGPALAEVIAPTLLLVGGADPEVLALNEEAARLLTCHWRLVIVPGATHLFEEPGALDQVVDLATDWFLEHLERAEP